MDDRKKKWLIRNMTDICHRTRCRWNGSLNVCIKKQQTKQTKKNLKSKKKKRKDESMCWCQLYHINTKWTFKVLYLLSLECSIAMKIGCCLDKS